MSPSSMVKMKLQQLEMSLLKEMLLLQFRQQIFQPIPTQQLKLLMEQESG